MGKLLNFMAGATRLELATSGVTGRPIAHSTYLYSISKPSKCVFQSKSYSPEKSVCNYHKKSVITRT